MTDFDPQTYQQTQEQEAPKPQQATSSKQKAPPPPPPQYLLDTLNETVCQTITRDLKLIGLRTLQLLWVFKRSSDPEVYEQWDVFGPLFYTICLSVLNYFIYLKNLSQFASNILPITLCIVFILAFVVSINIICIGGRSSIMGTICTCGYCCAPLVLSAIVTIVIVYTINVPWLVSLISALVTGGAVFWSLFATYGFFRGMIPDGRVALGVYPLFFYFIILGLITVVGSISGTADKQE